MLQKGRLRQYFTRAQGSVGRPKIIRLCPVLVPGLAPSYGPLINLSTLIFCKSLFYHMKLSIQIYVTLVVLLKDSNRVRPDNKPQSALHHNALRF